MPASNTLGPTVFWALLPFQFMFGLIYAWGGMAPVIHAQSGWPDAALDLAFSVTPLALFPSVLLGGYLAGRHEPKHVLAAAWVCFAGGAASGLCTTSATLFITGYACLALGLGAGLSTPACVALIGRAMSGSRGRWSGALLAVYGCSAVVSAPLFHGLASYLPWRLALAIVCSSYAALGLIVLYNMPAAAQPGRGVAAGARRAQAPAWSRPVVRSVVVNALLLLASVPLGSMIFAAVGRLALAAGFSASASVLAVTLMALANGAGRFAGGWLSDATSAPTARTVMLACAAAGYGALLLGQHGGGAAAVFWALPLLAGFSFGGLAGKLPALAAHTSTARATEVFSLYFGIFALSSFGGPILSAALGFQRAVTLCGELSVAALAASLWLGRDSAPAGSW